MKLIMESWNRFLNEEEGADLKEFYHATDWPVEDFIKGIDPRAEGYGQGKGFYVFSNKEDALEHAATLADVEDRGFFTKEKEYEGPDKSVKIIVIDPPLTPENFDIDYEGWGSHFIKFMDQNHELFTNKYGNYKYKKYPTKGMFMYKQKDLKGLLPDEVLKKLFSRISLRTNEDPGRSNAPVLSMVARLFAEEHPDKFRAFEEEILPSTGILKYNGAFPLSPARIEDVEGNVLWSRE